MKRWIKVAVVALVLALPVTAYAVHQYTSQQDCPVTSDCPCSH